MTLGRLIGVGVGPGDPELLTVKAVRVIQRAGVICVPTSRPGQASLAARIAAPYLDVSRQTVLELVYPTDRRSPAALECAWQESARRILETLSVAPEVPFLTEGDPMLYSTFVHTWHAVQRLDPSVAIEVVPGVSSITASAAASLTPLTLGSDRLTVIPADRGPEGLRAALTSSETTVIIKLSAGGQTALDVIDELDLTQHTLWVRRCGQADQQIERDVRRLRGRLLDYFSLLIVRRTSP